MTRAFAALSDHELMRRVQRDDSDAFGTLYDRLAPRAFSVAYRINADHERAQDAVQEGFLSMWRSRATYSPDLGAVNAWALGIIRNRAIDGYRRNSKHASRRAHLDHSAESIEAPDDVHADAVAASDVQDLETLLAALPVEQREVIVLAYYGKPSHTEVAGQLEIPLGTVKGRMRLGLSSMRGQLEQREASRPEAVSSPRAGSATFARRVPHCSYSALEPHGTKPDRRFKKPCTPTERATEKAPQNGAF